MGVRDSISNALVRVANRLVTRADGDPHGAPYFLPVTGGWLGSEGDSWNWWQQGYLPIPQDAYNAIIEACVSAYSQTVAMCPGAHWRTNDAGGRDRVTNSALSRVLKRPNEYQTISDFMLNMIRMLYLSGNAYALAIRNDRYEIDQLHLMNPMVSWPQVATTGDVFYRLGGNHVVNYMIGQAPILVPARDVLHFRLHISRARWPYPLVGETPLAAVNPEIATQLAIMAQQQSFFTNQARPSGVLSTDLLLDKDQVQALRDRWNEQSKGMKAGGTPILTAGLKPMPWASPPKDAAIAETLKYTDEHIALVYRIPLQILGMSGAGEYRSTEVLMQSWIATGLGFCLNHIEEEFGLKFGLRGQPDEYCEFNTNALLRSAMKDRIDALARGVQGGILSPNEARNEEGLDKVKFGDEPRVQQQIVPLSAIGAMPPPTPGPSAPPSAPPAPGPKPPVSRENVAREVRRITAAARRFRR